MSLFTEAIKTSLQLFHVASALNREHSWTSNYSFEGSSVSSRARHFPSHSLKFRHQGFANVRPFSKLDYTMWVRFGAGGGGPAGLPYVFQAFYRLDLQRAKKKATKLGEDLNFSFHLSLQLSTLLQCGESSRRSYLL